MRGKKNASESPDCWRQRHRERKRYTGVFGLGVGHVHRLIKSAAKLAGALRRISAGMLAVKGVVMMVRVSALSFNTLIQLPHKRRRQTFRTQDRDPARGQAAGHVAAGEQPLHQQGHGHQRQQCAFNAASEAQTLHLETIQLSNALTCAQQTALSIADSA